MPRVDRSSRFYRWVRDRNYTVHKSDQATHLLLCGGLLRLVDGETALERLAADMREGKPNYVVELRTPIFRMCADFDFVSLDEHGVEWDRMQSYMKDVQKAMRDMFPDAGPDTLAAVICQAPHKSMTKEVPVKRSDSEHAEKKRLDVTKSGYHVIWPGLAVDMRRALTIRLVLCQMLCSAWAGYGVQTSSDCSVTTRTTFHSWDDALDLCIYTNNGLRMVGSHKAAKCRKQHKEGERCPGCESVTGRPDYIDLGRPYGVVAVMEADGRVLRARTEALAGTPLAALQNTSIRTSLAAPEPAQMELPAWFEGTHEEVERAVAKVTAGTTQARRVTNTGDGEWGTEGEEVTLKIGQRNLTFRNIALTSQPAIELKGFIHNNFPDVPRPFSLTAVLSCSSKPYMLAKWDRKYCANVGREHNGQDTYWVFDGKRVYQRCWSSKEEADRMHGPCTGDAAREFFLARGVDVLPGTRSKLHPPAPATNVSPAHNLPPGYWPPWDQTRYAKAFQGKPVAQQRLAYRAYTHFSREFNRRMAQGEEDVLQYT